MREQYRCKVRVRRMRNKEGTAYEVYYVAIPVEYARALDLNAGTVVHVTLEV